MNTLVLDQPWGLQNLSKPCISDRSPPCKRYLLLGICRNQWGPTLVADDQMSSDNLKSLSLVLLQWLVACYTWFCMALFVIDCGWPISRHTWFPLISYKTIEDFWDPTSYERHESCFSQRQGWQRGRTLGSHRVAARGLWPGVMSWTTFLSILY